MVKKIDTIKKRKGATNQFNDDGTKKDTSVERLLKGVVKRARRMQRLILLLKFGRQLEQVKRQLKILAAIDVASENLIKYPTYNQK